MPQDPTPDSQRLRQAATEAFHQHLLPAIRNHLPQVEPLITATITSSVAYGTADQYSDLDVFLIFRRESDYRQHASALAKLVESLGLEQLYGGICDKGMRFEIESLPRADLAGLFHHPERPENWHRQTEWLLAWFLDSHPVHDPAGVHSAFHRRAGRWPRAVLAERQDDAWTRITTWTATARRLLAEQGPTYPAVRAAYRAATAGLEAAYLRAERFAPHPKWREAYANTLLADHPAAGPLLAAQQDLARVLATPPYRLDAVSAALERHLGVQCPPDRVRAEPDWQSVLAGAADTFTDALGTVRVVRERAPGPRVLHAVREAAAAGATVYMASETGSDLAISGRGGYDRQMRISHQLRWLDEHAGPGGLAEESGRVRRQRWRCVNFLIWRKLRVADKAARRGLLFTSRWYQQQVVDHLVEAQALLAGTEAPALHRLVSQRMPYLTPELADLLGARRADVRMADVSEFLTWGWHDFTALQDALVQAKLLDAHDVADPLASQWDIQYWKYENLFT
ncbi:hypothetical protein ABIA33_005615 [Streptacidiphilus sp. MAP12-16]|uniref:hypothetical protein n=1 Tax=Streptacidiphilus sp. MAP12-16 TaxID=3156300 RepID=UPI0035192A07